MPKQASDITNGIDVVKPPPGLRSVASATAAPCSISIRAGAKRPSFRKNAADGSSVATTLLLREHPRVRFVDEDQVIGGSRADFGGDARRRRSAPARRRGCAASARDAVPASRMSRDSSGVNTPCSQNTSHHSASPSSATAGIISSMTQLHVIAPPSAELDRHLVRAHERGGQLDRLVRRQAPGSPAASSARTAVRGRSRSSLPRSSCRTPASRPGARRAPSIRSCSLAARVASTVLTMPPPAAAISA